jgi:hypothetical protein
MNKAAAALELLAQHYGVPQPDQSPERKNPLYDLIEVIIGQNTSRPNRQQSDSNA